MDKFEILNWFIDVIVLNDKMIMILILLLTLIFLILELIITFIITTGISILIIILISKTSNSIDN